MLLEIHSFRSEILTQFVPKNRPWDNQESIDQHAIRTASLDFLLLVPFFPWFSRRCCLFCLYLLCALDSLGVVVLILFAIPLDSLQFLILILLVSHDTRNHSLLCASVAMPFLSFPASVLFLVKKAPHHSQLISLINVDSEWVLKWSIL